MIYKYIFFSLFSLIMVTASDPFFGKESMWMMLPEEEPSDVRERPWMSTDVFRKYLEDHEDKVSDIFKISDYYYPSVNFWFLIYTQFESSSVVFHDKSNLSIIYKVLDFSALHRKKVPKNTLYVLQRKLSDEKLDVLKDELNELVKNPFSLTPSAKRIYRTIRQAGVTLPIKESERVTFFKELKKNVRSQTGQKDHIRDGIVRSLPYQVFLKKYFTDRNLPTELLAIPFLESSFNPKAHSRVNALGVWQFMPLIGSYFVPKRTGKYDYRSNVGVSSVAAAFLLSENFRIMKSWDLAVTAYNSGTRHLLKTKRELASDNIDLEQIIKHSDSESFGFASKNFYSEFLALAYTLAYQNDLYPDLPDFERDDMDKDLRFYLSKCTLRQDKDLADVERSDLSFHNHHIPDPKFHLPRGFIVTSKNPLNQKKFFEIPRKSLLKIKPKDWTRLIARHNCSTR